MSDTDLGASKIINVNDFIFRQTLEFYPNLQGLTCENNVLAYQTAEGIITETLTFDLRTLPGNAWNVSPSDFINVIRINKSCNTLFGFISLLNQKAFDNILINKEELEKQISAYMELYFSAKDSISTLTEDNKSLLGNIEVLIASLPKDSLMGKTVNEKLDEYFARTKELGDSKGKGMVLELKNKNLPAITEEVPDIKTSSRAAYINVAILLYGILNIGVIIAIAFMK